MIESLLLPTYTPTHEYSSTIHYLEEEVEYSERIINLMDLYQNKTSKNPLNDNYLDLIRYIESLSRLKPGWMGEGSVPVTDDVVNNTKILLDHLEYNVLNYENLSAHPSAYGTIILDIDKEEKEFSIEIGATRISYYIDMGGRFVEEDNLLASDLRVIERLTNQVSDFLA